MDLLLLPVLSITNLSYHASNGVLLFDHLSASFNAGLHGLVGPNGAGKSTLLHLIAGDYQPLYGTIHTTETPQLLKQNVATSNQTLAEFFGAAQGFANLKAIMSGNAGIEQLDQADWLLPSRFEMALIAAGLEKYDADTPLAILSGGQCNRAAIAALFFHEPAIILLDEPTNNLDKEGRDYLLAKLKQWYGLAVIASHDRQLLNATDSITELRDGSAFSYGGNYDFFQAEREKQQNTALQVLGHMEAQLKTALKEQQKRIKRQIQKNKAGKNARKKNDIPKIALGRARARAEQSTGKIISQSAKQQEELQNSLDSARQNKPTHTPLSLQFCSTGLTSRRVLLRCKNLTGGYNNQAIIRNFSLTITGPERIAIAGRNGSGKTTLIKLLTGELPLIQGKIERPQRFVTLHQTLSFLHDSDTLLENFRRQNPAENDNACYAALARLGFRNQEILKITGSLSGGEKMRLGLACTIGVDKPPQLLFLDEPTNHLDINGIKILEAGLNFYDGALIVISHDQSFLDTIGITKTINISSYTA